MKKAFACIASFLCIVILIYGYYFFQIHPSEIIGFKGDGFDAPSEQSLFLKREGMNYLWVSNGNLFLKVFTGKTKWENGEEKKYTYLVNPEGEGIIVIRHREYNWSGRVTDSPISPNVVIYKKDTDGSFSVSYETARPSYPARYFKK